MTPEPVAVSECGWASWYLRRDCPSIDDAIDAHLDIWCDWADHEDYKVRLVVIAPFPCPEGGRDPWWQETETYGFDAWRVEAAA